MHYKNGREAKAGDQVILRDWQGKIVTGIIHSLNAECDTCNASVAVIVPGGVNQLSCITVGTIYHAEDAYSAMEAPVPVDQSLPE